MIVPRMLRWFDERLRIASVARTALAKVFPDHWSFMLGEIALYSFILLVATGTFLALFFEPSTAERVYTGSYEPLQGRELSGAFASSVELSFDVRGGLLMRQAHHWAAHIFIGSIVVHLMRNFFTAAFRRPRELNWIVGVTLLGMSMFNAFAGYSLLDDLLSGTGLHIFYSVLLSIPVVGSWLAFFLFGGDFPGDFGIERLYMLHILVIPVLIATLIAVHLAIIVRQKHTHFGGPGRSDSNVVGSRMWPVYAMRSLALLFFVAAVVFLLGGLAQINPVWVWGDFETGTILSPSVADWYVAWIEGGLRLFPNIEFTIFGYLVPNQVWAGFVLPTVTFAILYAWPFIDRKLTGDRASHHVTARPREAPIRVAVGVAALVFLTVLVLTAGQEVVIEWFGWSLGTVRTLMRILALALPVGAGLIAYVVANSLRRSERPGTLFLARTDLTIGGRRQEPAEGVDGEPRPDEAEGGPPLSEVPSWIRDQGRREK